MEKRVIKGRYLKERTLFPVEVHDIRNGCVLDLDFMANSEQGYVFDGVDDSLGEPLITNDSADVIINLKFSVDSKGALSQGVFRWGSYNLRIYYELGSDRFVFHYKQADGTSKYIYGLPFVFGETVTVTAVINSSTEKARVFINGVFFNDGDAVGGFLKSTDTIQLGRTTDLGYMKGIIYNFMIARGTLADEQVADLAEGKNVGITDYVCNYPLNGDGRDISGNGNDLTITGAIPQFVTYDQSGEKNNGTASNVKLVQGMGDLRGAEFNGTSGAINFSEDESLSILGDITLMSVFNFVSDGSIRSFFFNGQGGELAEANIQYFDRINYNNKVQVMHENGLGVNNIVEFDTVLEEGKDYVMFTVRDTTNKKWSLYLDGEFIQSKTYSNNATDGAGNLSLCEGGSPSERYNGIDSMSRIYDRILSAKEVRDLTLYLKKKAGII